MCIDITSYNLYIGKPHAVLLGSVQSFPKTSIRNSWVKTKNRIINCNNPSPSCMQERKAAMPLHELRIQYML